MIVIFSVLSLLRVAIEPYQPMRDWFDFAHGAIIELFSDLMSDKIQ